MADDPDKAKRGLARRALPLIAAFLLGAGAAWAVMYFRAPQPVQFDGARIQMCMRLYDNGNYAQAGEFAANCTKEERDFVFRFRATR